MQSSKWLSILLGLMLVLALALGVSAQDGDSTEEPMESTMTPDATAEMQDDSAAVDVNTIIPEGGFGLLTNLQGTQFVTGFQGAIPTNARVLGVTYLTGFDTYDFDLSTIPGLNMGTGVLVPAEATAEPGALMLADCGLVRVYKVSSEGSQDIWPNVACTGTTLSIMAGGDGHYILYVFNSAAALATAPETLSTCIGAFDVSLTGEATAEAMMGETGTTLQLDPNQACWNFSAITGMTTEATVSATAPAPTTGNDSADDDDDDDDATVEPTEEVTETPEP